MEITELIAQMINKEAKVDYIARKAASPPLVAIIIKGIETKDAATKYKCLKILSLISAQNPGVLYPYFEVFANLLESPQNIFKWNAIDITANLVVVDTANKFARIFSRFYGLLEEGSLITSGHVMESSDVIACCRPGWEPAITRSLLSVEDIPLPTDECRNILRGKVILTFGRYFEQSSLKKDMLEFARKQIDNSRPATANKARQFLKKFG
jgi:hypothetical protein